MTAAASATPKNRSDVERARPVVMMVEDDLDHRRIYGALLWYNGYNVFLVPDRESALRAIGFLRPDLVLLDLGLPDGSGLELCEALKRLEGNPIPVIALSAFPTGEMSGRALAAGCIRYMEKPLSSPLSVLHVVEEIIGRAPPSGEGATSWLLNYPKGAQRKDGEP